MICYLIWPCDIAACITYLVSHSSSLSCNTVIKKIFQVGCIINTKLPSCGWFCICIIQANLSNFKGQATIVARHVREKVRSESILYLQLVLIVQLYRKPPVTPTLTFGCTVQRKASPAHSSKLTFHFGVLENSDQ